MLLVGYLSSTVTVGHVDAPFKVVVPVAVKAPIVAPSA